MTVIAGLVEGSKIWMGGDSALSDMMGELIVTSTQKVFRNGPYLIGVCGLPRVADVLRYNLDVPKQTKRDVDTGRFMRTVFIDACRQAFRAGGLFQKDGIEDIDAAFLVGYRGRLFTVDADLHVHECVDDYAAVGSGGSTALGAMTVSQGVPARKRLINAMSAAERYIASVRRPFYVLTLEGP